MIAKTHDGDASLPAESLTTMPFSRASLLRGAAALGAGLAGAGLGSASAMKPGTVVYTPNPRAKVTIDVWYPYSGDTLPAFLGLLKTFENTHPDIGIKATYASNNLSSNQKLFAAVAAGIPPDVTWVDGPEVSGWGFRGILQSIDKYMKADNLKAEDFWAPCWKEIQYGGKFWALPYTADPNFGFFWNKKVFQKAGISKAPTTFDEMDKLVDELTVVQGGRIQQVGLLPWMVYGHANSMVTWGWAFGGSFFDQATNKVTANNPGVVAALEWMVKYAKKYDISKFDAFAAPFGGTQNFALGQVFGLGKIAMQPLGPWEIPVIAKYDPAAKYGISKLPTYKNVPASSWVGGWCVGISKGAKNPDAAWQFIKWICASDDGTTAAGKAVADFPGYKVSPFFKQLPESLKVFYPILQTTMHQRPVTPAEDYYMGQLDLQVSNALYGKKTPKQALDDCTSTVQKYLDGVLKKG